MQPIELEAIIGLNGQLQIPADYQFCYGKQTKLIILLADVPPQSDKIVDLMQYSGTLAWQVDGLAYQQQMREDVNLSESEFSEF